MKCKAAIDIVELPDNVMIVTAGIRGILHTRAATVEFELVRIYEATLKSTGQVESRPKGIKVGHRAMVAVQLERDIALEEHRKGTSRLGLLVFRSGSRTLATGHVV